MKSFTSLIVNLNQVEADLKAFEGLLDDPAKPDLGERSDILPFFGSRHHLSAFMGMYNPLITSEKTELAFEFDIFGDHVADLAVGDSINHQYCFIEFEDANESSIFKKTPKSTPEWSGRFEHGFSQLIDWILWIENNKSSAGYRNRFNTNSIQYNVLLILGRDRHITNQGLKDRLEWRNDQIVVASKKVNCITFDKLYADLSARLNFLKRMQTF